MSGGAGRRCPTFPVERVEAGADDDHAAEDGKRVGHIAPDEKADGDGEDHGDVAERRGERHIAEAHRGDGGEVSDCEEDSRAGEAQEVRHARHEPVLGEADQAAHHGHGAGGQEGHQERRYRARHRAGRQVAERDEKHRDEHQDAEGVEGIEARPDHDHDAEEADRDGRPSPPAHLLTEKERGAAGDGERHRLEDDGRGGNGHLEEREEIEQGAAELAACAPGDEPVRQRRELAMQPERDDARADKQTGENAPQKNDLAERQPLARHLDEGVVQEKGELRGDDRHDAADIAVGGGHPAAARAAPASFTLRSR